LKNLGDAKCSGYDTGRNSPRTVKHVRWILDNAAGPAGVRDAKDRLARCGVGPTDCKRGPTGFKTLDGLPAEAANCFGGGLPDSPGHVEARILVEGDVHSTQEGAVAGVNDGEQRCLRYRVIADVPTDGDLQH